MGRPDTTASELFARLHYVHAVRPRRRASGEPSLGFDRLDVSFPAFNRLDADLPTDSTDAIGTAGPLPVGPLPEDVADRVLIPVVETPPTLDAVFSELAGPQLAGRRSRSQSDGSRLLFRAHDERHASRRRAHWSIAAAAIVALGMLTWLVGRPSLRIPRSATRSSMGAVTARADLWSFPDDSLLGFLEVPAGSMVLGAERRLDPWADFAELPAHSVELEAFLIAKYEVTVAQFRACVVAGGCRRGGVGGAETEPARSISWAEAVEYCAWIDRTLRASEATPATLRARLSGESDGRPWHVTLPSEAEWERAVRGSDRGIAVDLPRAGTANTEMSGTGAVAAIGSFPGDRGVSGVFDVGGNVTEWTRSALRPYPYDPADGREALDCDGPRVARGGSFLRGPWYTRPTARIGLEPAMRFEDVGFRLVIVPGAAPARATRPGQPADSGSVATAVAPS
ncbi:MAG: SUMF1/EgtB/PvdO family nonheme iron enzyme [Vicinamibacterales bacterium]